jgi:hypothetical protein
VLATSKYIEIKIARWAHEIMNRALAMPYLLRLDGCRRTEPLERMWDMRGTIGLKGSHAPTDQRRYTYCIFQQK